MIRHWSVLSLALLASPAGASNEIKWTEEVLLHDGSVVQIKRRTELTNSGFPVQRRGFSKYHELCYPPLGVHWRSKPQYRPQSFDIIDKKAYVKVPVHACIECMLHDYPESDALVFVWSGEVWRKVDEKDAPPQLKFNLLSKSHHMGDDTDDARGLITLAEKRKRDVNIYNSMKRTGRNTPYAPGACNKCRLSRASTDATAEVFVAGGNKKCEW